MTEGIGTRHTYGLPRGICTTDALLKIEIKHECGISPMIRDEVESNVLLPRHVISDISEK